MDDEPTYISYPNGDKIDIMEVDYPLILDEMVQIADDSDLNKIKLEIKSRVDKIADLCIEKRGPIKDDYTYISCGKNELKKVQGPVWENVENPRTKEKYIRYSRSIKFID